MPCLKGPNDPVRAFFVASHEEPDPPPRMVIVAPVRKARAARRLSLRRTARAGAAEGLESRPMGGSLSRVRGRRSGLALVRCLRDLSAEDLRLPQLSARARRGVELGPLGGGRQPD